MAVTQDMKRLADLCVAAGEVILPLFRNGVEVERKADESPVTEADRRAEAVILDGLSRDFPDICVVAEEAMAAGDDPVVARRFFLVDPLDGTREFVSGRGEFTVNIALIEDGVPVLGAVFAPVTGALFVGARGEGSFEVVAGDWRAIHARIAAPQAPVALASRSHSDPETDSLLEALPIGGCISIGSSLKFCLVARGEADFYPRFGRTMEWDTAAGHAVLAAAGGQVVGLDGGAFLYGKRGREGLADFANPGFLAGGDPALLARAADLCRSSTPS
jgi:3'(2'),5'-bisphosphate nucleotidase